MSKTTLLNELSRAIASALADDRVARHKNDEDAPSTEVERDIARVTAASTLTQLRGTSSSLTMFMNGQNDHEVIEEAIARVLGLGRLEPLLEDDNISDIHIRGNSPAWVKLRDGRREERPAIVDSDSELIDLIRKIATRMSRSEQRFDPANPQINLQLPDGSRLFAAMEISMRPTLIIRRHRFEMSSLVDLVERGMMTMDVAAFLAATVRARRNIIIAGGTGTGKTTLLRALLNEVAREERLVTIEDAYELGIEHFEEQHPNYDSLQARPANVEGHGEITVADLTKMALRMDPDRVIVGEVRGAEAFPMLLAMSQGNNGSMCTLHADSARSVFPKLVAYVSMASSGVPTETTNLLIASAVHFVVHIDIVDGRRTVSSIREVVDADGVAIISNEIFDRASQMPSFAAMRSSTTALLAEYGFGAHRGAAA
jgi:Flp pilus assembly CpaF family ATPase